QTQRPDRKTLQLCRQVGRAIDMALSQCRDAALQQLRVQSVEATANINRLLVTLEPVYLDQRLEIANVQSKLERVQGMLRSEVAAAISRKRTPELAFHTHLP